MGLYPNETSPSLSSPFSFPPSCSNILNMCSTTAPCWKESRGPGQLVFPCSLPHLHCSTFCLLACIVLESRCKAVCFLSLCLHSFTLTFRGFLLCDTHLSGGYSCAFWFNFPHAEKLRDTEPTASPPQPLSQKRAYR